MARQILQRSIDTFDEGHHSPLEGQVSRKGIYQPEKDGKPDGEPRRFMIVASGQRFFRIYESAGLADMFDHAEVNDFVRIEALGAKQTKNKRMMKVFNTLVERDTDAPPAPEAPPDPWEKDKGSNAAPSTRKRR